ncbi:MAG: hypothetical protein AB1726_11270 [Planctomycetota bacterium]
MTSTPRPLPPSSTPPPPHPLTPLARPEDLEELRSLLAEARLLLEACRTDPHALAAEDPARLLDALRGAIDRVRSPGEAAQELPSLRRRRSA